MSFRDIVETDLPVTAGDQVEFERLCEEISSIDEILKDLSRYQTSITLLNLHGNRLTSTQSFPRMPSLRFLNLSSNHIVSCDMRELPCFTSLTSLDLSSNRIARIDDLPFLPGLENLYLSFNFIENLNYIDENCPNIQMLDVRGNKLKTPLAFLPLQGCGILTNLLLASKESPNPICENADKIPFFPKLFELIPNLAILDSKSEVEWNTIITNSNNLMVETPKFDKLLEKMKSKWTDEGKDEECIYKNEINCYGNGNNKSAYSNINNNINDSKNNANKANIGESKSHKHDFKATTPNSKFKTKSVESATKGTSSDDHAQMNNNLYLTIAAAPESNILMSNMSNKFSSDSITGNSNSSIDKTEGVSNNVHIQIHSLSASQDKNAFSSYNKDRGHVIDASVQCNIDDKVIGGFPRNSRCYLPISTSSLGTSPFKNENNTKSNAPMEAFADDASLCKIRTLADSSNSDKDMSSDTITERNTNPNANVDVGGETDEKINKDSSSDASNDIRTMGDFRNVTDFGVGTDLIVTESCGMNTSIENSPNLSLAKLLIRFLLRDSECDTMRSSFIKWAQKVAQLTFISRLQKEKNGVVENTRRDCAANIELLTTDHKGTIVTLMQRHHDVEIEMQDSLDKLRKHSDSYRDQCDQLKLELRAFTTNRDETVTAYEARIARKDSDILALQKIIKDIELSRNSSDESIDQRIKSEVSSQVNSHKEVSDAKLEKLQKEYAGAISEKDSEIQVIQSKSMKRIQLLKNVVDELKVSNAEYLEKNESLSKKSGEIIVVMNEMKAMIKQLKGDLSRSQNRNIELSTLLENEKIHFNDEKSTLITKINTVEARLAERQLEVNEVKQKFEAERASYDLTNKASHSSNKKLQDNVSDMYKRLDSTEREMKNLISELITLRKSDQEKSLALKVKEKMLADFQSSINDLKLKISVLESENMNLSERIVYVEDSYHSLKDEHNFIESQMQVKSSAEQDLLDLLSKLERSKDVKSKGGDGRKLYEKKHEEEKKKKQQKKKVLDGRSDEDFSEDNFIEGIVYKDDDVDNDNSFKGVDDNDDSSFDIDDDSIDGEFNAKSGKVIFRTKGGNKKGQGKVGDNDKDKDRDEILHRLFSKSVVCNRRKCRIHLDYLENELKLKDDIIAEFKLGKL